MRDLRVAMLWAVVICVILSARAVAMPTVDSGSGGGADLRKSQRSTAPGSTLIVNGSFEEGPSPGSFITLAKGSAAIRGWVVTRATIDYVGSLWPASDGKRSLDLDGTPGYGAIAQSFATIPGRRYAVSFDLAGNPQGPPKVKLLRVSAAGQSANFRFAIGKHTTSNMGWVSRRWGFTARARTTTLEFASLDTSGGLCGPALDNVRVMLVGQ